MEKLARFLISSISNSSFAEASDKTVKQHVQMQCSLRDNHFRRQLVIIFLSNGYLPHRKIHVKLTGN